MDLKKRVLGIILTPKKAWEEIKKETISVSDLYTKYAMILAAIPAISLFLGKSVIGYYGVRSVFRLPPFKGLFMGIIFYVGFLLGTFVLALIIDNLSPYFGGTKDSNSSFKIAVYSSTASFIGGIFHFIPAFSIFANIASLYSLYLLYLGLKNLKDVPQAKMPGYFITIIIAAIFVYAIIGFLASSMAFGGYAFNSLTGM